MAFPWMAAASAGINIIGSVMGGNAEADAARAANKAREKAAKQQHKNDLKVWELDYLKNVSDYSWQVASTAAQRYQERVREADYNKRQGLIIEAAVQNLQLNSEAIQQTYIVEEGLRAQQVSQELATDLGGQMISANSDISRLNENSQQLAMDAALANSRSMQTTAGYLNSINARANQADRLMAETNAEGQSIQEQILIGESMDTLRRDAEYITAIASGAEARARATGRQGGSNNSKRIAVQAMQQFGRTYGEMQQVQQDRRRNLSSFNQKMNGAVSAEFAQIATQMSGEADRIKYTSSENAINNQAIMLQQLGIGRQMSSRQAVFNLNTNDSLNKFSSLTIPSFELAAATGKREQRALLQNTLNTIEGASTPYREAIIFDPLEPIAGLKPKYSAPTKQAVPGTGAIMGNAFMAGVKGAMSQSYTDSSGNLAFR
jgi:hypothetical protein